MRYHDKPKNQKKGENDLIDPTIDDHIWGSPLSIYSYNLPAEMGAPGEEIFKKWMGPHLDYKVEVDYK